MSSIKITKPYLLEKDIYIYICTKLVLGTDEEYDLWYSIEKEYKDYISVEHADAFVVNLLFYAMEHKLDIECETKISEKLYYQLTEYWIPSITKNINKYNPIKIIAEVTDEKLPTAGAVGGSLSGGVDSFYTLLKHLDRKESSYNITHLTFFNAGASGELGGDEARVKYQNRIAWIKDVADNLGKKLICIDTNINEFLKENHLATHSCRTLALPLLLQKLFSKYYFASGTDFANFRFDEESCCEYDLLNVHCFSTENLTFYSSGGEVNRLEKVKYISDFEVTYSRLNVCVAEDTNCSKCEKCQRTMMELYVLGKLEKYKEVFDLDYFARNKRRFLRTSSINRYKDDWKEVYEILDSQDELGILEKILFIRKMISKKLSLKKFFEKKRK